MDCSRGSPTSRVSTTIDAVRLLILDRDGVINHDSETFIKSPEEWIPIPGSLEAIARASRSGYHVVVISNQSGLARGLFDIGQLNRIHARMVGEIERVGGTIGAIFFCPHGPDDGCECRKPRAGLLIDLGRRLGVDLKNATVVGDRESDMAAANAVGAHKIIVRTGHGMRAITAMDDLSDITVCDDLAAAVDQLETRH
jgi:D-glycero-D-manno-heptose 1,7-bisphosphate phosphatase